MKNSDESLASSPAPTGAPTGEIAGLRRMSDAHREHAQSAVEHNATLNRLLSIAEARADRLEAEVADLRRKLEEAEQKAERQWEGWVREEVARKAAERKLEEARRALEPFAKVIETAEQAGTHFGADHRSQVPDDRPYLSIDSAVTWGDFRRAAHTLSGASE